MRIDEIEALIVKIGQDESGNELLAAAHTALDQLLKEHIARIGPLPIPKMLPQALRMVADQVEAWESVMTPP
jgi:hypothetical protein